MTYGHIILKHISKSKQYHILLYYICSEEFWILNNDEINEIIRQQRQQKLERIISFNEI